MRCDTLLLSAALASVASAAGRTLQHVGRMADDRLAAMYNNVERGLPVLTDRTAEHLTKRSDFQFLTNKTEKFSVNGTGIPDVDFDVGESYAGNLPITSDPTDPNQLFFWFFPSTNPAASKEIVIWLNGGPGCSSLEGLSQENGPFLWQYGTFKPVQNTWSWNKLSNIIYIEQPVGTGFATGTPTATSEEDVAQQFLGFWKNFIDTFDMYDYKVYIAGESYAGMYCPYIASAMIDEDDSKYFNVSGMLIYDPVIGPNDIQGPIPTVAFVDYWSGLFPFNDSFVEDIHARDAKCGYTDYMNKYLSFPPAGQQPTILPGQDSNGVTSDECENIFMDAVYAAILVNPCFDIYQVATTCPLLWDVLGFPGTISYLPDGAEIYFDRADVKKAINAPPNITWASCSDIEVFVNNTDTSDVSGLKALPHVIDTTQNVIVAHGALDMVLLANGTILTIQNMTWGGMMGFQSPPTEPLYVPFHDDPVEGSLAGSGVMGTFHTERGLTYAGVALSGHMVPQYAPGVAYRQLEFLLGRIDSLDSVVPFTTDANYTQQAGANDLGEGNAPQGYASNWTASASETTNTTTVKSSPATKGAELSLVALAGALFATVFLA